MLSLEALTAPDATSHMPSDDSAAWTQADFAAALMRIDNLQNQVRGHRGLV